MMIRVSPELPAGPAARFRLETRLAPQWRLESGFQFLPVAASCASARPAAELRPIPEWVLRGPVLRSGWFFWEEPGKSFA